MAYHIKCEKVSVERKYLHYLLVATVFKITIDCSGCAMSLMSWLSVFVAASVLHLQCKCAWETGRKKELQTVIHVALRGTVFCSLALIPKKLKRTLTHTQRYSYTRTHNQGASSAISHD